MALAQNGDYAGSLAEYKKILPSEAEAYCEIAFVMKLQSKPREAMQAYEEALKRDPTLARARLELDKLRLTDTPPSMSPYRTTGKGVIEYETTPTRANEGTSRQMEQRPALPPLSPEYFDVPTSNDALPDRKNK
jgi:hypothetical protein